MRTVYECNGALSLDKEYLKGLANGKGEVTRYEQALSSDMMKDLEELNTRTFDADEYYQMVEDGHTHIAEYYWEQNHKCIAKI